jgi:hypothetical protein
METLKRNEAKLTKSSSKNNHLSSSPSRKGGDKQVVKILKIYAGNRNSQDVMSSIQKVSGGEISSRKKNKSKSRLIISSETRERKEDTNR